MILTCEEAQKVLVEWGCGNDQAQRDFLNDIGGRLAGGRLWCQGAEEPPRGAKMMILQPIRLHYVERVEGDLFLRAETCDDARATHLESVGAGVGTLNIRAQLYRVAKSRPEAVMVIQ